MDIWQNVPPVAPTSPLPPSQPTTTVTPDPRIIEHIHHFGHNTLWVTFVVMLISSLVFTYLSYRVTVQRRLFYQITTYITVIATLSYFAMASGSGWSFNWNLHKHKHKHDIPDTHQVVLRQIFYARYIDWLLTTPLLLLDLALIAGVNGANIINIVLADVVMILTGLFAAYGTNSRQKWGWYAFGWIGFIVIIWQLGVNARATAQTRGVQKLFVPLSVYTIVIWTLYPIIWGISDGSRTLSVDQEVLAYAILDILAKPVFGTWLLIAHKRMPATIIHLGGVWSEGLGSQEGTLRVGDDDEA